MTALTPRYEHTLECGHLYVSDTRSPETARCGRCEAPRRCLSLVARFVDAGGYRRGPKEVIAEPPR